MPGLHLLALDGGGVRGLVSLLILKRLLYLIDPQGPPKPCEVFDFIAGTSTGGLIAIMLRRLEMDIQSCIDAYVELSKHVFTPRKRTKFLGKTLQNMLGQAVFNHKALEDAIKRVVRDWGRHEDAQLAQASPTCRTFVCTSLPNTQTLRLRNYRSTLEEHIDCTIWEAARATSAAPTFFDPITLSNGVTFRDGALRDNNPIYELMQEVQNEAPGIEIASIVSIGTGLPRSVVTRDDLASVAKTCVRIATDAEEIARRFHRSFCLPGGKYKNCYFRFNVVRGVEGIRLDEWQKTDLMTSSTISYLREELVTEKLRACAAKLRNKSSPTATFTSVASPPGRASGGHVRCLHRGPRRGDSSSHHSVDRSGSNPRLTAISLHGRVESLDRLSRRSRPVAEPEDKETALTRLQRPLPDHGAQGSFYQLDRIGKQPVPYFVDRDEVARIDALFAAPARSGGSRVVPLVGLGGSGKTQILLEYAWSSRERFGVVLWFDARTTASLQESFRLAASQLGLRIPAHEAPTSSLTALSRYSSDLESEIELIRRELRRRQQPWLLLFDEADDLSIIDKLPDYMPWDWNGRVLVTSRRKEAERLGQASIKVSGLPVDGARNLLLRHADIRDPTPEDMYYAEKIVERLECIALAVDLAGTFAQTLGSLAEYLELYESQEPSIRDQVREKSMGNQHPLASGYKMSVIAAWNVSLRAISSGAANYLYLLCFLDPSNLSKDMFRRACSAKVFWDGASGERAVLDPRRNRVPARLIDLFCDENGSWNGLKFYGVVQELASFFFLHKEVLHGTWLHASGAVDASSLTSDGLPIVLLKLPQPVHDLGKYYLSTEQRREFGYNAFSVVIHSFRNSIDCPADSNDQRRHNVLHVGKGGFVSREAHLQRQLEESYSHLLVFKDYIKPRERFFTPLFDSTDYLSWHVMELVLFAATFWPEIMDRHEALLEQQPSEQPLPGSVTPPWQTIVQLAQKAMRQ